MNQDFVDLDVWIDATPEATGSPTRLHRPFGDIDVDFIDKAMFGRNKRALGRLKDLADIEGIE